MLLPAVGAANRVFGFTRVQNALAVTPERGGRQLTTENALYVVAIVELAARRGPFRANCLQRSMVTWWFLRRRGLTTSIRFGVRPTSLDQRPDFHAWLEHDGVVLNDDDDIGERFFPFDHFVDGTYS